MLSPLLIDGRYCRVWRASADLLAVMPPVKDVPAHSDYEDIWVLRHNGLEYVTSHSCEWHTDWPQMFNFLVAAGGGHFSVSNLGRLQSSQEIVMPTRHTLYVKRGHIIQLWPMAYHKVECSKDISMISLDGPRDVRRFGRRRDLEKRFIDHITKNAVGQLRPQFAQPQGA